MTNTMTNPERLRSSLTARRAPRLERTLSRKANRPEVFERYAYLDDNGVDDWIVSTSRHLPTSSGTTSHVRTVEAVHEAEAIEKVDLTAILDLEDERETPAARDQPPRAPLVAARENAYVDFARFGTASE